MNCDALLCLIFQTVVTGSNFSWKFLKSPAENDISHYHAAKGDLLKDVLKQYSQSLTIKLNVDV